METRIATIKPTTLKQILANLFFEHNPSSTNRVDEERIGLHLGGGMKMVNKELFMHS